MKSIHETRLQHVRKLAQAFKNHHAFAEYVDRPSDLISRYIGSNPSKNIGNQMARHIERCFKLEPYSLDNEPSSIHANLAKNKLQINEQGIPYGTENLLEEDQIKLLRKLSNALLNKQLSKRDIDLLGQLLKRLSKPSM